MFILYDLIFFIISIIYLPIYLFRRKLHRGFLKRLGFIPQGLSLNQPIWIHAVSVGEAKAVAGLLEELRINYPDKKFVISTVTATGNKIAQAMAKADDFVTFLPLDLSFIVTKVVDRINPALFIIAETEIWPNLITYLYRKKIPIAVVNARISDRSFKGYLCLKFLVKPILNKIALFCVQTPADAAKLLQLGLLPEKIHVTGNMKFDAKLPKLDTADLARYRAILGLDSADKLFVSGSTHPGEEEIILAVYKNMLSEFPQLKLLLAPRHPERAKEIEKMVLKYGFRPVRIYQLPLKSCAYITQPVFILDTIGQLINYYALADIVFVGGSLVEIGGHNILEPLALSRPVICGPYMFNFQDIADLFLENKACLLACNQKELETRIRDLLNNPAKIDALTQKAKDLILRNQGATQRNLENILQI
jgi:3-deoxy-D-manno-octulosonic-acid transferase